MSDLIVPSVPDNFRSRRGASAVPGDVYGICSRIAEKYPRLVVALKDDGSDRPYVIYENCTDGIQRIVCRYEKLDASVIEDLDYMQRVPFKERMRVADARRDAHNAAIGRPDEEKQEKWMAEFRQDLIKAGFVHGAASGGRTRNVRVKKDG